MKNRITEMFKKHRIDIIVVSAILIISLSVLLIFTFNKEEGSYVRVEIDGEIVAEYPLDKNGTYILNEGTNILVIEDGKAYFSYSSCPDHICEKGKKKHHVGETIVCLPNKVSATIVGSVTENDGVDFVPGG